MKIFSNNQHFFFGSVSKGGAKNLHKIKHGWRKKKFKKASRIMLVSFKPRLIRNEKDRNASRLKSSEILENGVVNK